MVGKRVKEFARDTVKHWQAALATLILLVIAALVTYIILAEAREAGEEAAVEEVDRRLQTPLGKAAEKSRQENIQRVRDIVGIEVEEGD